MDVLPAPHAHSLGSSSEVEGCAVAVTDHSLDPRPSPSLGLGLETRPRLRPWPRLGLGCALKLNKTIVTRKRRSFPFHISVLQALPSGEGPQYLAGPAVPASLPCAGFSFVV